MLSDLRLEFGGAKFLASAMHELEVSSRSVNLGMNNIDLIISEILKNPRTESKWYHIGGFRVQSLSSLKYQGKRV